MLLNRKDLLKIIISAIILIIAVILKNENISLALYIIAYIIAGFEVVKGAIENIFHGEIFDENFLMSIATIGAFFSTNYSEAVSVMLLFDIGEMFEEYAEEKSRKSISALMEIKPDYANIKRNGNIEKVSPEDVKIDDIIIIKPGEKVPLDGTILNGKSSLDTKALTGETLPREVRENDEVLSGCINLSGMLEVKVTKEFKESTVSKILDLVENASTKKAKAENFITRFAKYYTPIVVAIAVIIAIVPSFILKVGDFGEWGYRALTFLVVSCPCALVISVPLSFFGGIGGASKRGILIKGSNYMEALARADTIVFDKTGTLTEGSFRVQKINAEHGFTEEELLEKAAYVEYYSNHPVSISIKNEYAKNIESSKISDIEEVSGHGISGVIDGKKVHAGNKKHMDSIGIEIKENDEIGTVVHIAIDQKYAGNIVISDEIKRDTKKAITALRKMRQIKKLVMLTGDLNITTEKVGKEIEIDEVYSELLPNEKVQKLEEMINSKQNVVFVGDGINDAPVLARADVRNQYGKCWI